jgi:hypothetical protein
MVTEFSVLFLYVRLSRNERHMKERQIETIQMNVLLHRCVLKSPILCHVDPHFFFLR